MQHTIFMNKMSSCIFVHFFSVFIAVCLWNNSLHLTQHFFCRHQTKTAHCKAPIFSTFFSTKNVNLFRSERTTFFSLLKQCQLWTMFVWKKQLENNKVISPSDKGDNVLSVHFILSVYCWPTLWQKILNANFKGEKTACVD